MGWMKMPPRVLNETKPTKKGIIVGVPNT